MALEIFISNRLSNGNLLFPTELHVDDTQLLIVKPGIPFLVEGGNKSLEYKSITSVEVINPKLGFSKIVISAYGLDKIIIDGFEQYKAEEAARLIRKNMK